MACGKTEIILAHALQEVNQTADRDVGLLVRVPELLAHALRQLPAQRLCQRVTAAFYVPVRSPAIVSSVQATMCFS